MHTVVVKYPQWSKLCLGLWYQPMRISRGRAVENEPYASILDKSKSREYGEKTNCVYVRDGHNQNVIIYHPSKGFI